MSRLRVISPPFVVAPPAGVRVRTRLRVSTEDDLVLRSVGAYLGALANKDLARRCSEGNLDAKSRAESRRERKRALTEKSSSRWAGAITRTSEDAFQLGLRNLLAEARSLRSRIKRIETRLLVPVASEKGAQRGYATHPERFQKQRRLQLLRARLVEVESRIENGRVSVCRGGSRLAKVRHDLNAAGLTETEWCELWDAKRLFLTADGESAQTLGNLTIRFNPADGSLELRLPSLLEHLANRPAGRYRLSCPVSFTYRSEEVAAQVVTGAIRYDISLDAKKDRWYLDASWRTAARHSLSLDELRSHPVLAVDLNHGHLAVCVLDSSGNPLGCPLTVPIELKGLPSSTRDGRLRAAVFELINTAKIHNCRAIVIENLDFAKSRKEGREEQGRRPSRGRRGRSFRRLVADLPTAKFRDRLVQMATNKNLPVIAVDPAYSSKWGAEHWLGALKEISPKSSGHHAAALVIGRRGLGHRARRRERCDLTRAEHREKRATNSAVSGVVSPSGKPEDREADGRSHLRQKTQTGKRPPPVTRRAKTVRARPKGAVLTATS